MTNDVASIVGEANYPCSRQELIDYALEQGADDRVVQTLQSLSYRQFNSPAEVSDAFIVL